MPPDSYDEQQIIAQAIRDAVLNGAPWARDRLAAFGVSYVRSYVLNHLSRRRFGFRSLFLQVAEDVADAEIAELLRPESGEICAGAPVLLAQLERELCRDEPDLGNSGHRGETHPVRPSLPQRVRVMVTRDDASLYLAFREILRLRGYQGLERRWAEENPAEGRLLRRFQEICRRSRECRLLRAAAGRFLVTSDSKLGRRALTRAEIDECLASFPGGGPRAAIAFLALHLKPCQEHGGYCYLLDLVLAFQADRVRKFEAWWKDQTREQATLQTIHGGFEITLLLSRVRESMRTLAEEILARDRRKAHILGREVWIEVAVEMVLHGYGLTNTAADGIPGRGRVSQRRLLEQKLGEAWVADSAAFHMQQTTYLIRRLRAKWERERQIQF